MLGWGLIVTFDVVTAPVEAAGREAGGGEGCANQGVGDEQAAGAGGAEPASTRTEPQV